MRGLLAGLAMAGLLVAGCTAPADSADWALPCDAAAPVGTSHGFRFHLEPMRPDGEPAGTQAFGGEVRVTADGAAGRNATAYVDANRCAGFQLPNLRFTAWARMHAAATDCVWVGGQEFWPVDALEDRTIQLDLVCCPPPFDPGPGEVRLRVVVRAAPRLPPGTTYDGGLVEVYEEVKGAPLAARGILNPDGCAELVVPAGKMLVVDVLLGSPEDVCWSSSSTKVNASRDAELPLFLHTSCR